MAAMTLGGNTAVVTPTRRSNTMALTMDDTKVLGNYSKRLEKTTPPDKFKTRLLKTHNSNWTPVVHRPSNKQIFKERKDLVSNWFDMWTDSQRKEFLKQILSQFRRPQYGFIQNWFTENVPLRHLDFTRVLPRFLSLHVMSFLDPRSLSRASQVCWHWKFLAEQDVVWRPKCARQGWFLPYSPASNEYGAWKKHYLACIKTLDMQVLSTKPHPVYGGLGDGSDKVRKRRTLNANESADVMTIRPPWLPPDKNPQDLRESCNAMLYEFNPNDPKTHESLLKHHNKWGIAKKGLSFLSVSKSMEELDHNRSASKGLMCATRKSYHRGLDDDDGLKQTGYRKSLGEYLELSTFEERRLMELVNQPWEMEGTKKNSYRNVDYPVPWNQTGQADHRKSFPNQTHPRIIFISSRVPAADILVDAVLFGVIPIVYEYEGTTLLSMENQLERSLAGRSAQSVGFFLHCDDPGDLKLVYGDTMNVDNLDKEEYVTFWTNVTSKVLPSTQRGHVDFFVPLASCESGNEMIAQLGILTGMIFTSPSGIIGNYNHVNSEWLRSGETDSPPSQYFCSSKLNVWANTADQAKEACKTTKQIVGRYFQDIHKDVMSQLTGQLLFDAMNVVDIHGAEKVAESLVEGLIAMGTAHETKPLEFLGRFLLEKSGAKLGTGMVLTTRNKKPGETLAPTMTMSATALSDHLTLNEDFDESLEASEVMGEDEEVAELSKVNKEQKNLMMTIKPKYAEEVEESIGEEIEEKIDEDEDEEAADNRNVKLLMKPLVESGNTLTSTLNELENPDFGFLTSRKPKHTTMRITAQELAENPEKRTLIAREIMASELDYVKTLEIVQKVFYNPLKNALASNRAIVSAQNLQVIFSDALAILDVHRVLLQDLKGKLATWDADECLGDVFVRFCSKLKIYTNFLNNYQTILTTIERSMEQSPLFRAFRRQHERAPDSKMLTLAELLLYPARRIGEYVTLLSWFHMYTPSDHADRDDLQQALLTLKDLNRIISQCKTRMEREKELKEIQKKIINCPLLLEANRYFIKQLDVANLKQQTATGPDDSRLYAHAQMLGLFLFNDSLVVTRRTTHNFPFSRAVEFQYKFETCCSLGRLKIVDMTDSKYISNAFTMLTPNKTWVCKTDTFVDKFNWITLLENRIKTNIS